MFTLGEIEQSEHNLLGAINEDDFLEALDAAPVATKKKFYRKMQMQSRVHSASTGSRSRAEFEKRIHLLPAEIQKGLANHSLQAVDTAIYVVKSIAGSKVIKMFKEGCRYLKHLIRKIGKRKLLLVVWHAIIGWYC